MKFVKLLRRQNSPIYEIIEYNNSALTILGSFLIVDFYKSSKTFLEWLINSTDDDWIAGNETQIIRINDEITIYYEWIEIENPIENKLKFSTNYCQFKKILNNWIELVAEDPWHSDLNKIPMNLLITQKEQDIKITSIGDNDIRFSALTNDFKQPNAIIEKSDLFEQYYKVRSNNKILYKTGLTLTTYLRYKQQMVEWLRGLDKIDLYYDNKVILYKANGKIFIENNYDQQKKEWVREFPVPEEDFIKLLDEWESLISQSKEKATLKFDNERIVLLSSN